MALFVPPPGPLDPATRANEVAEEALAKNVPVTALDLVEQGRERFAIYLNAETYMYFGKPRPPESFAVRTLNYIVGSLSMGPWNLDKHHGNEGIWANEMGMELRLKLAANGNDPTLRTKLKLPIIFDEPSIYFELGHDNEDEDSMVFSEDYPFDPERLPFIAAALSSAASEALIFMN